LKLDKIDEEILLILSLKPLTFKEIQERLNLTEPTLSKHLKKLVGMLLITKGKEEKEEKKKEEKKEEEKKEKRKEPYHLIEKGKEEVKRINRKREVKENVIEYFIKELNPFFSLLDYIDFPIDLKMKYIKKLPAFNLLKKYLALLYIETLDKDFINEKEYITTIKNYWKITESEEYTFIDTKFSWGNSFKKVLDEIKYEKENTKEDIKKEILEYIEKLIIKNEMRIFKDFYEYSKNEKEWCLSIDLKHYHRMILSIMNGISSFIIKILASIGILYLLFLVNYIPYDPIRILFYIPYGIIILIGPLLLMEIGFSFLTYTHKIKFTKTIIAFLSIFIHSLLILSVTFLIIVFLPVITKSTFIISLNEFKLLFIKNFGITFVCVTILYCALYIISNKMIILYYNILKGFYHTNEILKGVYLAIKKEDWKEKIAEPLTYSMQFNNDSPIKGMFSRYRIKNIEGPIKLKSFIDSLKPLSLNNNFIKLNEDQRYYFLKNYWSIIKEIFPNAFNKDSYHNYIILKTIGIHILNYLANDIFNWNIEKGIKLPLENDIKKYIEILKEFDFKYNSKIANLKGKDGIMKAYMQLLKFLKDHGIEEAKNRIEELKKR
jgi:DNA-binding MarR family transcriptional regulator